MSSTMTASTLAASEFKLLDRVDVCSMLPTWHMLARARPMAVPMLPQSRNDCPDERGIVEAKAGTGAITGAHFILLRPASFFACTRSEFPGHGDGPLSSTFRIIERDALLSEPRTSHPSASRVFNFSHTQLSLASVALYRNGESRLWRRKL